MKSLVRRQSQCAFLLLGLATACLGRVERAPVEDLSAPGAPASKSPPEGPDGTRLPGADGVAMPTMSAGVPPVAALRRLTAAQFESTLRDLLGELPAVEVEPDAWSDGLASVAASQSAVSPRGVELYESAARAALEKVFGQPTRRDALIGCVPRAAADDACARSFVESFGRRAWRRPLTEDQLARYVAFATRTGTALADAHEGLKHAAWALLQSPRFLYRVELPAPGPSPTSARPLDGFSRASRLAYLLTGSTPDDDLLAAAAAGKLATPDGMRAEGRRLLSSPRGRRGLHAFADELLQLRRLATVPKDARLFPQLTPTLRASMRAEVHRLVEDAVLDAPADWMTLFDRDRTFVDGPLARLYGLSTPGGASLVPVTLPAGGVRAGLLGTGALLTLHGTQSETSPSLRGKYIREGLLCEPVPEPPDDVDVALPEPPAGQTLSRRQLLDLHRKAPACAGCHALMDPIGYGLEHFDGIGAYRERDHGLPIDASGSLDGASFANARELGRRVRESAKARACFVAMVYRYATGQRETDAQAGLVEALGAAFSRVGGRLDELLLEVASSEVFTHVSTSD